MQVLLIHTAIDSESDAYSEAKLVDTLDPKLHSTIREVITNKYVPWNCEESDYYRFKNEFAQLPEPVSPFTVDELIITDTLEY